MDNMTFRFLSEVFTYSASSEHTLIEMAHVTSKDSELRCQLKHPLGIVRPYFVILSYCCMVNRNSSLGRDRP